MEFLQTWQQKQWGDSVKHEKISAKDLDVIGEFAIKLMSKKIENLRNIKWYKIYNFLSMKLCQNNLMGT